jgi:DNA-binding CsgD family transcriptional regulator
MHGADQRIASWVDVVGDLLNRPTTDFPRLLLERQLSTTYDSNVSWNWMDPGSPPGFTIHLPVAGWPTPDTVDAMAAAIGDHPLIRWYTATGDLRPMSIGRVPRSMLTPRGRAAIATHLAPVGLDSQLSIPYSLGPGHHRAFVIARGHDDYSRRELELACAIQPLIRLLERHYRVMGRYAVPSGATLTPREVAVTRLLAEGLTATAIGHQLAISTRTVHRHLDHVYRKLGVSDRVRAVLAAQDAGLLVRSAGCDDSSARLSFSPTPAAAAPAGGSPCAEATAPVKAER